MAVRVEELALIDIALRPRVLADAASPVLLPLADVARAVPPDVAAMTLLATGDPLALVAIAVIPSVDAEA